MLVSSQTKTAGGGKIVLDSRANNRDYKNVHFTKAKALEYKVSPNAPS